ncbi:MAG: hypothetical protein CMI73_00615 [Candidatus Pelagibacter sp.]|nr:hypothetical protein [Candidatus Pelagibacter sp.]OUV88560.1 MAG: hypothetical protein CBC96_00395 [Pelagibacteraceae bacterium TMED136]
MNNLKIIKTLCYSGLIPFYVLSVLNFYVKSFIIIDIFTIYSLVILSFLFGSTWLYLIIVETKENIKLFLLFVILSPIFLILCEIFLKIQIKLLIFAIFFFLVQLLDNKFLKNLDYLKIRKKLTILVIVSHILILISIYPNGI